MFRGPISFAFLVAFCALTRQSCLAAAAAAPAIDPQVEPVGRAVADFYHRAHALTVRMSVRTEAKLADTTDQISREQTFAYDSPNRFALLTVAEGVPGSAVVSDGKRFVVYSALLNRYEEKAAPARFVDAAIDDDSLVNGLFPLGILASFFEKDPYAALMEGVTAARDLGVEKVGAVECAHLAFTQEQGRWEIWVQRGPTPLILREKVDAEKVVLAQFSPAPPEGLANLKASITIDFHDWTFDQPPAAAAFAFQPPSSAKKSETAETAAAEPEAVPEADTEEEPSELVGKPQPDLTLPLVGGGEVRLSDLKGKKAVILDLWATWCGPCMQSLPLVTEVAKRYRDKGVEFYTINAGEDEDTVTAFLKKAKLEFPVTLDEDGKLMASLGIEILPQTLIIDKAGIVQYVHSGFSPETIERMPRQLDAVLAGKVPPRPALNATLKGLERAWDAPGKFGGVAAAGSEIYALNVKGACQVLDGAGKAVREFPIESHGGLLRAAHLSADAPMLLCFDPWGAEVKAFDAKGVQLWTYGGGEGVNDVCAADLKGDGGDEVVIGYNGSTGLHVLSSQGKLVWKNAKLTNVAHVAAGSVSGSPEVFAVSARGDVTPFDAAGNKKPEIQPGSLFADMVRLAPGGAGPVRLVVGGAVDDHEAIAALDANGQKVWDLAITDGKGHIDAAVPAPGRPWLALALRGGKVLVVDIEHGSILAESAGEAARAEVAWLAGDKGPLLLVTGRGDLHAYRVPAK